MHSENVAYTCTKWGLKNRGQKWAGDSMVKNLMDFGLYTGWSTSVRCLCYVKWPSTPGFMQIPPCTDHPKNQAGVDWFITTKIL